MHISFFFLIVEWICANGIAEIGGKKKLQLVCGNAIAEIEERDIKKSTHILIL